MSLVCQCHSFCKQCLHNRQFKKTRYSSPNLSKLARADISCQFKKTRYLCRHCLQKELTLGKELRWCARPTKIAFCPPGLLGRISCSNLQQLEKCVYWWWSCEIECLIKFEYNINCCLPHRWVPQQMLSFASIVTLPP